MSSLVQFDGDVFGVSEGIDFPLGWLGLVETFGKALTWRQTLLEATRKVLALYC